MCFSPTLNFCVANTPERDYGSYFFLTGPGHSRLIFWLLGRGWAWGEEGRLRTQNDLPDWLADGAVTGGRDVEMFGELVLAAQKISINENMRGKMVIFHRKSGYTIAEATTGEKLTLCASAAALLGKRRWPHTHCRQEDEFEHNIFTALLCKSREEWL